MGTPSTMANRVTIRTPLLFHVPRIQRVTKRSFSATTTIPSEVQKFSELSGTWWNPRANPLLAMNAVRMQFITSHLSSSSSSSQRTILDVGCGGGVLSEALVRRLGDAVQVTGIDASKDQIRAAQQHAERTLSRAQQEHLQYIHGTIQMEKESAASASKFDVVCCLEVIEHVQDPQTFLSAVCEQLQPGGLLFVSTLNKTPKSFAAGIVGAEYVLRLLPRGTHSWEAFQSPQDVERMLEPVGLRCVQVSGMVISPTLSMLCGDFEWKLDPNDTDVNWIGCYQKEKIEG